LRECGRAGNDGRVSDSAAVSDDRPDPSDYRGVPTFEAEGRTFYRRLTFVAAEGRIVKVFYPVFPPDRDAAEVLAWLGGYGVSGTAA
jgi:peroxiredoxin